MYSALKPRALTALRMTWMQGPITSADPLPTSAYLISPFHNADTAPSSLRDNPVVLTCKTRQTAVGVQFSLVVVMNGQASTISIKGNRPLTPTGPSEPVSALFQAAPHFTHHLVVWLVYGFIEGQCTLSDRGRFNQRSAKKTMSIPSARLRCDQKFISTLPRAPRSKRPYRKGFILS